MSTIWIAGYAAFVSTAALAWNVWTSVQSRRTKMTVDLSNAVTVGPLGDPMHVLAIQATNRSGHDSRVTMFGLEANDGSGRQLVFVSPVPGSTLPGPIPAHDSASGYQPIATIRPHEVDLRKPVTAFVQTSENKRYRSKPVKLIAA